MMAFSNEEAQRELSVDVVIGSSIFKTNPDTNCIRFIGFGYKSKYAFRLVFEIKLLIAIPNGQPQLELATDIAKNRCI